VAGRLRLKQLPTRNSISFVSDPLLKDTEIDGSLAVDSRPRGRTWT
jgi:hypothetical protein